MTGRDEDTVTPAWVDKMSEDIIIKDRDEPSWFYGGHGGVPLRYHQDSGFINAYDSAYLKNHHDDMSLRSRSTHSRSSRGRRSACCLMMLLILGALLVAIGIGLMVYYLLRPDPSASLYTLANGSVPLLNVPYNIKMADRSSQPFRDIEDNICTEMTTFFRDSQYVTQYYGCKLEILQLEDSPPVCTCNNITVPFEPANTRAYINLIFRGDMGDISGIVNSVIENHYKAVQESGYEVLMIDEYIVNVEKKIISPTTTIKPPGDVGVRANLTIWVYNMTYTNELANRTSESFVQLAVPFCQDLGRIFLTSPLQTRYHSCRIEKFSTNPNVVIVDVWFTETDVLGLDTSIKQIVLEKARNVTIGGINRKMIGTLLITPSSGNDSNVIVVPVPVNPDSSTIFPTPTVSTVRPTDWIDGMPYVETILYFTGVDFTYQLVDRTSTLYQYHAQSFCKEIERMVLQSSWKEDFYDCNLINIYPPKAGELYPSLRNVIHVTSNVKSAETLRDIIMQYGVKYIFPGNVETYRVGDLYVILSDGTFSIYSSTYGTHTPTVFTSATSPLPSIFTSTHFQTFTTSPWNTVLPSVSTVVIIYNATAAFIQSGLVDFTYTSDLGDKTSARFRELETRFCNDMNSYFISSTMASVFRQCNIESFTSDPTLTFVLQFTTSNEAYLRSTVPSIIVQKAPKAQIRDLIVLQIGGLNLLYDALNWQVSVTNFTMSATPTPTPTLTTMTMTSTKIPPVYSATLVNIVCEVGGDINLELLNKQSSVFVSQQRLFCQELSRLFSLDGVTAEPYLDCYIIEFSQANSTVQFHTVFAEEGSTAFGNTVLRVIHLLSNTIVVGQSTYLNVGGVYLEQNSCTMNIYPVNYTSPSSTLFTTLTPTTSVIFPTSGFQDCLRQPCKHEGTCVETVGSYRCVCKAGWTGRDCENDVNECQEMSDACFNGGTCTNTDGSYRCTCFTGYLGDRCDVVIDRCASSPCQNGGRCTGSDIQLCICADGWTGTYCEQDVNECSRVPSVCQFNGVCENLVGSFRCICLPGRTGPTCSTGIDECSTIQPCRPGSRCLDTDYSYTCVCAPGWTGVNCTEDDNECNRGICENGGSCTNTPGSFQCACTSGWTGPTCTSRYSECTGQNPCLNGATCIDTTVDFQCLCPRGWTGSLCETDVNECLDANQCNGRGVCTNMDGGFRCDCQPQWEGVTCDLDHDECSDARLGTLCLNGGECINQWGSYSCQCPSTWTGYNCEQDVNECAGSSPICLHNGICTNTNGGFFCSCPTGWIGSRCQTDVDECASIFPCLNNATCTNKVGSYLCTCTAGWRGTICDTDINECVETPGVCRNGGTCINEIGDYRCLCPEGRGGKDCDYSTDPCNDFACFHGGTCKISFVGNPYCLCTDQFTGLNCQEDFDECVNQPCVHGTCKNIFGTYYCECDAGFTGPLCDQDVNECLNVQCVHGQCNNTLGSFSCLCEAGWTGRFCNIDRPECSLLQNPCYDNGRCEETPGSYRCVCYIGYEGQFCQNDINECNEVSCQNGATCSNYPGGYECVCTDYWTGPFCEIDINECTTMQTPCANGGTCTNRINGYDCQCTANWTGNTCNQDIDECSRSPGPCLNSGTCQNKQGGFTCDCSSYYTGNLCQNDVDECNTTMPCQNGATCVNSFGSYNCICAQGFEGTNCQTDVNECLTGPCQNGATCVNSPPGDFTCECTSDWKGKICDIEVARCPTCANGGICVEQGGVFTCDCPEGWQGSLCQQDKNECLANPCENDATCSNTLGSYTCRCLAGYTGTNCESNINECASNPCLFGGTCIDAINSFTCQCVPGREGVICNQDVNECAEIPARCKNQGVCVNTAGSFLCTCPSTWQGPTCEIDVNECQTITCLHGGACENLNGSFYCRNCTNGWMGQRCEQDVNECTSPAVNPCRNNGTCLNTEGSYLCDCHPGWTDPQCSTDVNECFPPENSPCLNNADCENNPGSFLCNCLQGFTGTRCERDVDECATNNPCQNGAVCVNFAGGYKCNCKAGWRGTNCDIDIDECQISPCLNGGTCTNTLGSYQCTCTEGWTLPDCAIDINECTAGTHRCVHGTCSNLPLGSYSCVCSSGWEGRFCDIDVNECLDSLKCVYGTCSNTNGSYSCICNTGFEGTTCERDIDECVRNQTMCNNGVCTNTVGDFECTCNTGWTGTLCNMDINECTSQLNCQNGGTCTNTPGSFICTCPDNFAGPLCTQDVNECQLSPPRCQNGATCTNGIGTYVCSCTDFWRGKDCEIDVDECQEFGTLACTNNGVCTNTIGNYLCNCTAGFTGTRCTEDVNECNESPTRCKNGATCSNQFGTYFCDCTAGFTGQNCETNINECNMGVCVHATSCVDTVGSYTCVCEAGWTGPNCDTDINECNDNLCKNGATCSNSAGSVQCICTSGWTGVTCETEIDACVIDPCENGGTCRTLRGSPSCLCSPGWTGETCNTDVNECLIAGVCRNGGTCVNNQGSFTCACPAGWTGETCETDVNECLSVVCKNGATCANTPGSYTCVCEAGWSGPTCEQDVNECLTGVCKNGATCTNSLGSYTCVCRPGWTGSTCEQDVNECQTAGICMHGGTCVNTLGSFTCACQAGWTGSLCETDVNECLIANACRNGGTCNNTPGSFTCTCAQGWSGNICDADVNECQTSGMCSNGGTCVNTVGSFICTCPAGWTGSLCETDVNECLIANACRNGGTCNNTPGSFTCTCAQGWSGNSCDADINECLLDVCKNGATCNNLIGTFACVCTDGWSGRTCEQEEVSSFTIKFETVGLTITPELLDSSSAQFLLRRTAVCNDLSTFLTQNNYSPYRSCDIKFSSNPGSIDVKLNFSRIQAGDTGDNIRDLLLETRPKTRIGDVYSITLGDLSVKHSDVIITNLTMTKRLLNFTYTTDLQNTASQRFQSYEEAFCTYIQSFMDARLGSFPTYDTCSVNSYRVNASGEVDVTFNLEFLGSLNATALANSFNTIVQRDLPKVSFDRFEGYKMGDFLFYYRDLEDIKMSFSLLDVPWNPALADPTSDLFRQHADPFCIKMTELIRTYSTYAGTYAGCKVDSYSNGTPFVIVNFSLGFNRIVNPAAMRSAIANVTYRNTPEERYGEYIGHRVSDLVYYQSLTDYFQYEQPYDGWIANFTFSLFDYSSYRSTLEDPNSAEFKARQNNVCEGDPQGGAQGLKPEVLDTQYYSQRFLRCFVQGYRYDPRGTSGDILQQYVSLLFYGKQPIIEAELLQMIEDNFTPITVTGVEDPYYFIGYDLALVRGMDAIKVNISDYLIDFTTTTAPPNTLVRLSMRFPLLNFNLTDDYLDNSTFIYRNSSQWFCSDISFMLNGTRDNGLPRYGGCDNIAFYYEGDDAFMSFDLIFHEEITDVAATVQQLLRVITEKAKRDTLPNNTVALVLGPFLVFQDSLQPIITNPDIFATPPPGRRR